MPFRLANFIRCLHAWHTAIIMTQWLAYQCHTLCSSRPRWLWARMYSWLWQRGHQPIWHKQRLDKDYLCPHCEKPGLVSEHGRSQGKRNIQSSVDLPGEWAQTKDSTSTPVQETDLGTMCQNHPPHICVQRGRGWLKQAFMLPEGSGRPAGPLLIKNHCLKLCQTPGNREGS